MSIKEFGYRFTAIVAFGIPLATFCAAQIQDTSAVRPEPSYEAVQPISETLDLAMYQRIRDEGLLHSHVMGYASALSDDIGPRLTGSPNMARANTWTRNQLTAIGCSNAHLEDWGEFGMGWQQLNTWVRMTSPDIAVFIAQAVPWSPSTNGPVSGHAVYVDIQSDKDFDGYRGKLDGKIVLLGALRAVPPVDRPLVHRYSDQDLTDLATYPVESPDERETPTGLREYVQRYRLREKIAQFLFNEKVTAVIRPSRDQRDGGGSGGNNCR